MPSTGLGGEEISKFGCSPPCLSSISCAAVYCKTFAQLSTVCGESGVSTRTGVSKKRKNYDHQNNQGSGKYERRRNVGFILENSQEKNLHSPDLNIYVKNKINRVIIEKFDDDDDNNNDDYDDIKNKNEIFDIEDIDDNSNSNDNNIKNNNNNSANDNDGNNRMIYIQSMNTNDNTTLNYPYIDNKSNKCINYYLNKILNVDQLDIIIFDVTLILNGISSKMINNDPQALLSLRSAAVNSLSGVFLDNVVLKNVTHITNRKLRNVDVRENEKEDSFDDKNKRNTNRIEKLPLSLVEKSGPRSLPLSNFITSLEDTVLIYRFTVSLQSLGYDLSSLISAGTNSTVWSASNSVIQVFTRMIRSIDSSSFLPSFLLWLPSFLPSLASFLPWLPSFLHSFHLSFLPSFFGFLPSFLHSFHLSFLPFLASFLNFLPSLASFLP